MKTQQTNAGFTLSELILSLTLTVIVVSASVTGYIFMLQGERLNSTQAGLDINVRTAINQLRHDLRLSAMDKIVFYPPGPGPYSAISFPMTTPANNGLVNYGTNGLIVWDKTVIYHIWSGQPNQLRITTFSPRDNTMTDAQRQAQLASVVTVGNGSQTYNSGTASTRVLFNNLVQWNIYPQQAVFDGYSSNTERAVNYALGSVALSPGSHSLTFTVIGKNTLSSGYNIGLDTLVMSPSGLEREAEAQTVSAGSATATYMANGGWSGNYRLLSSCSATGQYFTLSMENDRWEETNFRGAGATPVGTTIAFDTNSTPYGFTVSLEGPGYTWYAQNQTLDATGGSTSGDALRGCAVRVLLRGRDMVCGNNIMLDGSMPLVLFRASSNAALNILSAYIAECSDPANYNVNAAPTNSVQLFNWGSASFTAQAGGSNWAWSANYQIDRTKSYLISFLVANNSGQSDAAYWTENNTGAPGSWILPASLNPDAGMTSSANWSSYNPIQTNLLFGVYGVYTCCPTNGIFTSQIVDTHQAAPSYLDINWSASKPYGTYLGMKVRSGNQPDLSDAAAWTNVTALTSPGSISPGSGRYVQFQATMKPESTSWPVNTPKLRSVTTRWTGVQQIVDIGGTLSKGPDHGIWQLTVDGVPLIKGCSMDLTIYQDMPAMRGMTNRLTSTVNMEIYPRNTGK